MKKESEKSDPGYTGIFKKGPRVNKRNYDKIRVGDFVIETKGRRVLVHKVIKLGKDRKMGQTVKGPFISGKGLMVVRVNPDDPGKRYNANTQRELIPYGSIDGIAEKSTKGLRIKLFLAKDK